MKYMWNLIKAYWSLVKEPVDHSNDEAAKW